MSQNAAQAIPENMDNAKSGNEGALLHLPLNRIEIKEGFNTRPYIDPVALQELADSIKAIGVAQAITVRPNPDKDGYFILIAGERRVKASNMAGLTHIPAYVRDVSEKVALVINGIENSQRENISAAEEAVQVRRMVDCCEGDRDEAARHLGYSRRVVDARLLLLNASPSVREALAKKQIKVGHAELLSCLPADKQDLNLARIIETGVSVEDFRTRFSAYALNLSSAIFDTSVCIGCDNNTSKQASLFDTHIGEGRCTNHACFEKYRQAKIRALKTDHQKTFNKVELDSEKDKNSFTLLIKTGPHGVGREQFAACLGCANFGVLMSTAPGEEGRLQSDVCFDTVCNKIKAAEYSATLSAAAETESPQNSHAAGPGKPSEPNKASASKPKTKATASATPKRVEEIIHRFYRDTAAISIQEHQRMGLVYAAYALLNDVATEAREVMKRYGLSSRLFGHGTLHKGVEALAAIETDKLKALVVETAMLTVKEKMENWNGKDTPDIVNAAKNTLKICNTDLSKYFLVDRTFIESHTKSGIEALMIECGFDKWYTDKKKEEKAFSRLMARKNDEIVMEITSSGFDFKGFVPRSVRLA